MKRGSLKKNRIMLTTKTVYVQFGLDIALLLYLLTNVDWMRCIHLKRVMY